MSIEAIRPSGLDGIKRLAKSIKNEQGIQHIRALDVAAQSAGFQNFRHAQNVLKASDPHVSQQQGHPVFLTAYWKEGPAAKSGRETLTLWLDTRWSDLVSARQLKDARALGRFRPEGPDHLVERYLSESQSEARKLVCAAARTLQFMDATKLRPSAGHSGGFPNGGSLPGCDHYSTWYDRNSKRYVLADEPYEGAALSREAERTAWAARHGFTIAKPSWPGMYNPGGRSQLYLVSDSQRGIPLEPLVSALDQLPEPIVERTWNGDSAPATPRFVSPGSLAQATKRSVVSDAGKPARLPQSNSVSYVQTFVGPQRRPKGKMPIEAHAQVGQLLKSVLAASYYRMGVHNRVDAIHSELDEWTQREYTDAELPNERFLGLYYNASGSTFSRSISAAEKSQHVASLESVKQILLAHYPDSAPLRALLKKVDGAIKSMQSWV